MLFFIFVITEIIIFVTVVIIMTWLLIKFQFKIFYVSVDSHLFLPKKQKNKKTKKGSKKFFCGTKMEIKPHSFSVLNLPLRLVYIFFILHYSLVFDCKFIIEKLCKIFRYWVHFCDGERYLLHKLMVGMCLRQIDSTKFY